MWSVLSDSFQAMRALLFLIVQKYLLNGLKQCVCMRFPYLKKKLKSDMEIVIFLMKDRFKNWA